MNYKWLYFSKHVASTWMSVFSLFIFCNKIIGKYSMPWCSALHTSTGPTKCHKKEITVFYVSSDLIFTQNCCFPVKCNIAHITGSRGFRGVKVKLSMNWLRAKSLLCHSASNWGKTGSFAQKANPRSHPDVNPRLQLQKRNPDWIFKQIHLLTYMS